MLVTCLTVSLKIVWPYELRVCTGSNVWCQAYSPLGGGSASNAAKNSDGEMDGTRWVCIGVYDQHMDMPVAGTFLRLLLTHPLVQKVSEETGKTPAQVLLRWALQQERSVFIFLYLFVGMSSLSMQVTESRLFF